MITYGPAILIPYFVVEACDCLKAECVFGTDIYYNLVVFILALGMNVRSHLQCKIPLKFGVLFWFYPLETNFKCCLLKKLGILEKVAAIKYDVSLFSRYT